MCLLARWLAESYSTEAKGEPIALVFNKWINYPLLGLVGVPNVQEDLDTYTHT